MALDAVTLDGSRTTLNDGDLADLRGRLRGQLVVSADPQYENARRVWNGNVDRRPALVARCAGAADVQQAVSFACSSPFAAAATARPGMGRTTVGS
jgi:hypothetical protein